MNSNRCDNELYGCSVVVKLDSLSHHLKECEHNPKKPVPCSQGCGLTVPKDEMVSVVTIRHTASDAACNIVLSGRAQLRERIKDACERSGRITE